MFFISRSRFDDMLREKNTQIGYRDRRIAELEAERRRLWDKICLLGIGATVFRDSTEQIGSADYLQQQSEISETPKDDSGKAVAVSPRLPSMIMRRMDRLAEERWLRKVRPAKVAEQQRDDVMNELNAAHMDGLKAATSNFKNG